MKESNHRVSSFGWDNTASVLKENALTMPNIMTAECLEQTVSLLRTHVKSPSFVYAVGYALEKVHSGVMAHLVNGEHGRELAAAIWNLLNPAAKIVVDDMEQPTAEREYRIAKGSVIDLRIRFHHKRTGQTHWILCEYKVEGTGNHDRQCQAFHDGWIAGPHGDEPTTYAFVTLGGARFWRPPSPPSPFHHVDIPDVVNLLEQVTNTSSAL
ncbi:MAG: hypothetical protein ABFD92_16940 [Planctomycetaceae bacterium]